MTQNKPRRVIEKLTGTAGMVFDPAIASPVSAMIAEEARLKHEEFLRNLRPGDVMPDQSIYLGKYSLKGKGLAKVFNVFAAPQLLPGAMSYEKALDFISRMQKWHGYDGTSYATDKAFLQALEDGRYTGGWVIPPYKLVVGITEPPGPLQARNEADVIQKDNLFDHRERGSFADLNLSGRSIMSSTLYGGQMIWAAELENASSINYFKDTKAAHCLPVRLMAAKP